MKKTISILLCSSLLLISMFSNAKTIKVNNTLDLLNAIDSDCEIIVEEGYYNISEVIYEVTNSKVSLIDEFDGPSPNFSEVSNLKIIGNGRVEIVIDPKYSWVMSFTESNNLIFENLILGHTESGYCTGGVFAFESCNNIDIKKCSLYGSGTVGIYANYCTDMSIVKSDIYECTYGLAYVYNSTNISFEKTSFRKTGEFNLIEIQSCTNVEFVKCKFEENFNDDFMPYLFSIDESFWGEFGDNEGETPSANLSIIKCRFNNNKVHEFCNKPSKIEMSKNKFTGNTFKNP